MKALLDNDVILKCSHYDLLDALIESMPPSDVPMGILGSARYVLTDVLRRGASTDSAEVLARLLEFIGRHEILEPTLEEQSLAAEFEACAQAASLPLDPGESLLCAILILRPAPVLITGDKRAIAAVEQIGDLHARMGEAYGKVCCIEQLVLRALTATTVETIRAAVCARPAVDKALFNCCGCSSGASNLEELVDALNSYIRALRGTAERTLCA